MSNENPLGGRPRERRSSNFLQGILLVGTIIFLFAYLISTGYEAEKERNQAAPTPTVRTPVSVNPQDNSQPQFQRDSDGLYIRNRPGAEHERAREQREADQNFLRDRQLQENRQIQQILNSPEYSD